VLAQTSPRLMPYPKSQGKDNMALVQKNPQGGDYVMQIKYPQGEYGTEGGAQFYQRLKSMAAPQKETAMPHPLISPSWYAACRPRHGRDAGVRGVLPREL
jgi:hypothetical protein